NATSGYVFVFFFQAEDGIRDRNVTGVQTCALPILEAPCSMVENESNLLRGASMSLSTAVLRAVPGAFILNSGIGKLGLPAEAAEIGRASCRERVESTVGAGV